MDVFIAWLASVLASPEFTGLILTSAATAATAIAGWAVMVFRRRVLNELSAADLALLRQIASVAVTYAEQRFKEADGPAKLDAAIKAADTMIASYGLKVTVEQLRTVIEAAVYAELAHASLPDA